MGKTSKSAIKKLEFLIGKWITEGTVLASDTSPELNIKGTDTCELVSNGSFILHTVDVTMGEERVEAIEVIGFDEKLQKYAMQSFDDAGQISFMAGHFDNHNAFLIISEMQRATLTVNRSSTEMSAFWEQSDDGKQWIPWMNITFKK